MDSREELREFLTSRRARVSPEQVGLVTYGQRRVPGLRRSEVAQLAGVSVEYYTRLERGNAGGASDSVLEALAGALRLDDAERAHLFALTRIPSAPARARRRRANSEVRPGVQQLLDAMSGLPAIVQNGRLDLLASNALGRALFAELADALGTDEQTGRPPNFARFTFLDPRAHEFYPEWKHIAGDIVAMLRAETGRSPDDRALNELIGELTTRSEPFSTLWAAHNVRLHATGTKLVHHPVVGELLLSFEAMQLTADPSQTLTTFTAEPGSPSQQALAFLASWAGTQTATATVDTAAVESDPA